MEPCIRCGMCCIVSPCDYSGIDGGICPYLVVHEDLTTSCTNKEALNMFVVHGNGCFFQSKAGRPAYKLYMEVYNVTEIKKEIRRKSYVKVHEGMR